MVMLSTAAPATNYKRQAAAARRRKKKEREGDEVVGWLVTGWSEKASFTNMRSFFETTTDGQTERNCRRSSYLESNESWTEEDRKAPIQKIYLSN